MKVPAIIINRFGGDYVRFSSTNEVIYRCPFCKDIRGSDDIKGHLYIHTKKLLYFCHRCESSGSLVDDTFDRDAVQIESDSLEKRLKSIASSKNAILDTKYPYFIPSIYPSSSEGASEYLFSRGVDTELQKFYDIRVGDLFSDMFGRIIVPNFVYKTNYTDMYVGRSFIKDKKKYKNPINSPKGKIVFNLHRIEKGKPIIITEGVFSAISAGKNAVATYGKYVSDYQMDLILKNVPSTIFVCLDSDASDNAHKLCEKLSYRGSADVRLVELPEDQDPSDLGNKAFMSYLEASKPYFKLGVLLNKLKGRW